MPTKEDHAEVTLGILIKIPPNLLLDLSPITFGRIKMFSKFIFLCLQNMVSGQQVDYINLARPSHPQDLHIVQDLKKLKVDRNGIFKLLLSIQAFFYGIHNRFYNLLDPQLGCGWLGWDMMLYFSCWPCSGGKGR